MKRLNSIENDQVSLEVGECDCGYHFTADFSLLDQKGDITFDCPGCGKEISTKEVFPVDEYWKEKDNLREYCIPVLYTMYGHIYLEAATLDEAIEKVENDPCLGLPEDASYLDDSWEVDVEGAKEHNENNT